MAETIEADYVYLIDTNEETGEEKVLIPYVGDVGGTSLPLGTAVYMDAVLGFEESKGYALAGTYVYKDAVADSRYGYPTFIEEWFKQYDEAESQTMIIAGVEITAKVHANGRIFFDIADKSAIDDLYTAVGVADMWGIDKENNRIFTPRNDWFVQGCNSVNDVNGFNEAGLPNITASGTNATSGYCSMEVSSSALTGALKATSTVSKRRANDTTHNGLVGGFNFDASRSSDIYGNSSTVQPKSVNKLLYYVVGNTETQTAITSVTEVTTTENDTLPLLHHIAADEALNHPSWLRSHGQWNDGNVYTSVYNYLVNEYTNGTAHTDTITAEDGTEYTIEYKTINGKKVVDYSNVSQVNTLYSALGSAWYYVINQDDMTFKLPQSNNSECYTSDPTRLGLDVDAGLPNITGSGLRLVDGGSQETNGVGAFVTSRVGSGAVAKGSTGSDMGISFDASKSSSIYGNADTVVTPHTEFYLYFKVANAVQNVELLDVGKVMEEAVLRSSCSEAHVLVETYSSGTSWYRLYSDGWCKQGGRLVIKSTSAAALDYATATLTFLKPFTQLLNWQVQPSHDCFQGVFAGISYGGAYASVSVGQKNMTSSAYINPYVSWEAEGFVE